MVIEVNITEKQLGNGNAKEIGLTEHIKKNEKNVDTKKTK